MEYEGVNLEEEKAKRHSKTGISSFVIAIISISLFLLILTFPLDDTNSELIIGLMAIFAVIIAFIGIVLGAIGCFAKEKKRVFAIIGVILNLMLVLFFISLMIFG